MTARRTPIASLAVTDLTPADRDGAAAAVELAASIVNGAARRLAGTAKKNADQITGQAKTQAGQLLAEVTADAERRRAATQREVDDLTRQKDSIASHLAQVRQLLPGMNAVQAAQTNLP